MIMVIDLSSNAHMVALSARAILYGLGLACPLATWYRSSINAGKLIGEQSKRGTRKEFKVTVDIWSEGWFADI